MSHFEYQIVSLSLSLYQYLWLFISIPILFVFIFIIYTIINNNLAQKLNCTSEYAKRKTELSDSGICKWLRKYSLILIAVLICIALIFACFAVPAFFTVATHSLRNFEYQQYDMGKKELSAKRLLSRGELISTYPFIICILISVFLFSEVLLNIKLHKWLKKVEIENTIMKK